MEKHAASTNRVDWVDVTKGVGIILVVFGHVWIGLYNAGILSDTVLFRQVEAAVYLFHMPLFFFVSGLFFAKSVSKQGFVGSLRRRIETQLYPLLLWSYVIAASLLIAGEFTSRDALSVTDALLFPFPPKDIFWFLWALFVIQTLVSLLPVTSLKWLVGAFVFSCLAWLVYGKFGFPTLFAGASKYAPYLLAGMLVTRLKLDMAQSWLALIGAAAFIAADIWVIANWTRLHDPLTTLASMIAMLGFCSMLAWASVRAPQALIAPIRFLGVCSMTIYVSHVIPLAATRIAMVKLGITDLPTHLIAGTILGTALPLAFYVLAQNLGLLRVLGLGKDAKPFSFGIARQVPPRN